ncbi:transposase [Thioclava sp. JE_KL1]|uniref:transposase n=1 Tax=Thioclava sp. JE_KL1 TaxID=2651187 RepID=UPI0020A4626E|nr:transposase [Thioclava sp. JE_KL1]
MTPGDLRMRPRQIATMLLQRPSGDLPRPDRGREPALLRLEDLCLKVKVTRVRELVAGSMMLEAATEPMQRVRATLCLELAGLEKQVRQMASEDPVCLRLTTMPGGGGEAVVAPTYRSAVDAPSRSHSSKNVDPWVGLTPSRHQSGERDVSGGITKAGDVKLRRVLSQAATVMLNRGRGNTLWTWATHVAKRRGRKRAMVALARRMAVVLHRMWVDGTSFRLEAVAI